MLRFWTTLFGAEVLGYRDTILKLTVQKWRIFCQTTNRTPI